MPPLNKVNPHNHSTPFIIGDLGEIIGVLSESGAVTYFPASVSDNAITASTSSDQAGAVALKYRISRVTVSATAGDSVRLPSALVGMSMLVINAAAANAMDVFPASGEIINALSADTALSVAANKAIIFSCAVAGTWNSNLTA